MGFGENIVVVRKKKGLSQEELAKKAGTIAVTIGRYERGEIKPSIDMAVKIAQALDVSLDFLTGNSDLELDKNALNRIREISKLPEKDQDYIYVTLDALIRDFKNKQAFGINH